MEYINSPDVSTVMHWSSSISMGSLLLTAGAPKKVKDILLPNARIMVHQPSAGFQGQATDIQIFMLKKFLSLKESRLNKIYAKHTGRKCAEI